MNKNALLCPHTREGIERGEGVPSTSIKTFLCPGTYKMKTTNPDGTCSVIRHGVRDEESLMVPLSGNYDLLKCIVTEPPFPMELQLYSNDKTIIISSDKYNIIEFPDAFPMCIMTFVDMYCKIYLKDEDSTPKIAVYGCYISADERVNLSEEPYDMRLTDGRVMTVHGDITVTKGEKSKRPRSHIRSNSLPRTPLWPWKHKNN